MIIAVLFLLALYIPARPALAHFGPAFLTSRDWDPVTSRFGALPFLFGTVLTAGLAMLIAIPVGIAAALVLSEPTRWTGLRALLSFGVELLAAIPSVVVGLWALFILVPLMRDTVEPFLAKALGYVPFFKGTMTGFGFLTAGLVLAVMVLPILIAISRDVITAVPVQLREASLALGATRAETSWQVLLPYARAGITGAVLLALGRAIGETIAVTMVIGNRPAITAALFSAGYTMPSVLANEFTEAVGALYQGALFEIGLLLVLVTIVVNVLARLLVLTIGRGSARL